MQIRCPKCKHIQNLAKFCASCGARFEVSEIKAKTNWKPAIVIVFFIVGLVLVSITLNKRNPPTVSSYSATETELTRNARGIVGFDDGGVAPSSTDQRVKRAEMVLDALSKEFGEPSINVSFAADLSVKFVEETYKKKITRLQVLEDFWKFYSTAEESTKKGAKTQQIKDSMRLFALLKYK